MEKETSSNGFMRVKVKRGENLLTIAKLLEMEPRRVIYVNMLICF